MVKIVDIIANEPLPHQLSDPHVVCIVQEDYAYCAGLSAFRVLTEPSEAIQPGRYVIRVANELHRGIVLGTLTALFRRYEIVSIRREVLSRYLSEESETKSAMQEEIRTSVPTASSEPVSTCRNSQLVLSSRSSEYQGCYRESLARITELIIVKSNGRTTRSRNLKNQIANITDGVVKRCQLESRIDFQTLTQDLYLDLLQNHIIEERGTVIEWDDSLIRLCFVKRTHPFKTRFDRQ